MLESGAASDLEEVRRHTRGIIEDAHSAERPVLVEAPPNSNRSTAACELAAETDMPVTYLTGRTDLYERAIDWCEDQDNLAYGILPIPHQACPTLANENEGWETVARRYLNKGYSVREIHNIPAVYTPCSQQSHCPFLRKRSEIEAAPQKFDLLIGKSHHANRRSCVDDRVVVLDGYNATPFHTRFPPESATDTSDALGDIIPYFFDALEAHSEEFPTDRFHDLTDVIEKRHDPDARDEALAWFQEHGITQEDASGLEFYPATSYRYDATHLLAPFLVCSLLSMERMTPGIELAPPSAGPLREAWMQTGVDPEWQCIRNRNTGEMFVLRPPNLSDAAQVIGLDTFPSVGLWNLLFARDTQFAHRQVIERQDYQQYLADALNVTTVQIGGGMHHYAGGRMSSADKHRFALIRAREGNPFALISTEKVLEQYDEKDWLVWCVKSASADQRDEDTVWNIDVGGPKLAAHYGAIPGSTSFEKEPLGAVFGSPYPGDEVVKRWAAFCGHPVRATGMGTSKSFDEPGDEIYHHFAHHQVLRAALRFGRAKSIRKNGGTTVYISTRAIPEWLDVENEFQIQSDTKEIEIIKELIRRERSAEQSSRALHAVKTLKEELDARTDRDDEVTENHVRATLNTLQSCDLATVSRDRGWGGADLYRWDGDDALESINGDNYLLVAKDKAYRLSLEGV